MRSGETLPWGLNSCSEELGPRVQDIWMPVTDEGARVFFNKFLSCVLVVLEPSKAWGPRQEPPLPRCTGSPGCGSASAFSPGTPSAQAAEGFLPGDTRGSWPRKEEWQMVLGLAVRMPVGS